MNFRIEDFDVSEAGRERRKCVFDCPRRPGHVCEVLLKPWPISGPTWHWNGNRDKPSLTPSVHCNGAGGCGAHFYVTDGKMNQC